MAGYCTELSPEAGAIGAVNVVQFLSEEVRGHNTDVIGVRETLREQKFAMRGKRCLILGAGGAAAAVGYVLGEGGAGSVVFRNRDTAKARALAGALGKLFRRTEFVVGVGVEDGLDDFDLYVNATPTGMKGFPVSLPVSMKKKRGALAFDLVYRPAKTAFLARAKRSGLASVGGLDMLIWQAIGTWEIWFGRVSSRNRLKSALKRHLTKIL
jgi:shikimate dehydrogenase